MCKNLLSAAFGAVLALVTLVGSAEARVERADAVSNRSYGSLSRAHIGQNFKATSSRRYAQSNKKGKRYAKARNGGKYRVASRKGTRMGKRSFTRYARSGGGGGSSRSCLTSQARALLNRIESNFGPVSIVSTCRPGAVIAGSGKPSKHRYGQAIDFDAGSRKGAIVAWLKSNHHSGGTMTYRDMSHIHVDIGQRFVKLGANSRRG